MYRLILALNFIICSIMVIPDFAVAGLKNTSNEIRIKHINFLTQKDEILRFNIDANLPSENKIPGSTGAIRGRLESGVLKSLNLLDEIFQHPDYPERTILFTKNELNNYLTCGTLINPHYMLISDNEYLSAVNSPDAIYTATIDVLKELGKYGKTWATDIYLLSDDPSDTSYDLAILRLDDPIGAVIGWMGYAYADNSYFQGKELTLTQLENTNGDGFYLQKYSAIADEIHHDALLYTPLKNLTNGSPVYNSENSILGVLTSYRYIRIGDVTTEYNAAQRLNANKFSAINSIISSGTPNMPDIMPLNTIVSPNTIEVENSFDQLIFYLHNYSSSIFTGNVKIDIYLSEDYNIDPNDLKLKTYNTGDAVMDPLYCAGYAPNVAPSIPAFIKPGIYYIGAIIDTEDFDVTNNATTVRDCDAVLVSNPQANNYMSGSIITSGESLGAGYCLLFKENLSSINGVYDIFEIGDGLEFEFENIVPGEYTMVYVPLDNNNERNVPTYYGNTPFWSDATYIEVGNADSIRGLTIERIELPVNTGDIALSGLISQNEEKSGTTEDEGFYDGVSVIIKESGIQEYVGYTTPDANGGYSFTNIGTGNYDIMANKAGYTLENYHTVELNGSSSNISNLDFIFFADSTINATGYTFSPLLEDKRNLLMVYPNPVSAQLNIDINFGNSNIFKKIHIFDINGKIVKSLSTNLNEIQIDISNLPSGIYHTKLISGDQFYTKIFVKK